MTKNAAYVRTLALLFCFITGVISGCNPAEDPSVNYSLVLFVSTDGSVQVKVSPDVVINSVELSSGSHVLWQAQAPSTENLLAADEYVELSSAPAGWTILVDEFTGFEEGQAYFITVTTETGEEVTSTWTYRANSIGAQWMSRTQIGLESQMAIWPFAEPTLAFFNERTLALYGCTIREAAQNQGICTLDDLTGATPNPSLGALLSTILQPTPNLPGGQIYGMASVQAPAGWSYNAATAVSLPLQRTDGVNGIAIAQLMYNPATPSGAPVLTVLESGAPQVRYRYNSNPFSAYETQWNSEWSMVGGTYFGNLPAGAFAYRNYKPTLLSGTVSGLGDQNITKPYVVSAISSPFALSVHYFDATGSWQELPVDGIVAAGDQLKAFEMARSSSGDLYGCLTFLRTSPLPHHEVRVVKYDGASSWTTIASQSSALQSSGEANMVGCRIRAQGNHVVAAVIQADGNLWIRKLLGNTATEMTWPAGNPMSRIWDLVIEADGSVNLAMTDMHQPDATGVNVNLGPKYGLYRSTDGEIWTTVVSTYGAPIDGLGEYTYLIRAIQIRPDLKSLSAFGYSYYFEGGVILAGNYWPSIWNLIAP